MTTKSAVDGFSPSTALYNFFHLYSFAFLHDKSGAISAAFDQFVRFLIKIFKVWGYTCPKTLIANILRRLFIAAEHFRNGRAAVIGVFPFSEFGFGIFFRFIGAFLAFFFFGGFFNFGKQRFNG